MLRCKLSLALSLAAACAAISSHSVLADPTEQRSASAPAPLGLRLLPTDTLTIGPEFSSTTTYYCSTDDTIKIVGSANVDYETAVLLLDNHEIQRVDLEARFNWLVEGPGMHTLSINFLTHGDVRERTRPCHIMVIRSTPVVIGDFNRAPLLPVVVPLSVTNEGFAPVRMGVLLDDKPMPVREAKAGYECPIPVVDLASGHHSLRVEAWDQAGNRYEFQDPGFDIPMRFIPSLPTSFIYTNPDDKLKVTVFFQAGIPPGGVEYYLKKTKGGTGNLVGEADEAPFRAKVDVSALDSGRYYLDIVAMTADGHSYQQSDIPVDLQNQVLDAQHAAERAAAFGAGAAAINRALGGR